MAHPLVLMYCDVDVIGSRLEELFENLEHTTGIYETTVVCRFMPPSDQDTATSILCGVAGMDHDSREPGDILKIGHHTIEVWTMTEDYLIATLGDRSFRPSSVPLKDPLSPPQRGRNGSRIQKTWLEGVTENGFAILKDPGCEFWRLMRTSQSEFHQQKVSQI